MIFKKRFFLVYALVLLMLGLLSNSASAAVREYWIAADEVLWDYAPSFPINPMSGDEFTPEQRVFVEDGIGRQI